MPRLVRTRLAAVMFVFYFSLGAWVVTLSTFLMSAPVKGGLNFTTGEVGFVYSAFAFGGMLAPLVIGVLTDRLFRAERVMGCSCVVGGALLLAAGWWCDDNFPRMDAAYRAAAAEQSVDGRPALEQWHRLEAKEVPAEEAGPLRDQVRLALDRVNDDPAVRRAAATAFGPLFGLMLVYCFFMQLSLTLTTVVTLRNLPDPTHDFGRVRLFGTLGWITAGIAVQECFRPATTDVLYVASVASFLSGFYAFTLPATRPKGGGRSLAEAFGLPALKLFKDRSFVVFVVIAFLTTTLNQFYVVYAHRYLSDLGVPHPAGVMTVAQVCEMGCMFALPFLGPRKRMKMVMAIGLGGYAIRGAVLASGWVPGVLALGVPMHGWGYAFFFLVAATYLDREAPPHLRASAQGIITFVSGGVGVWTGNMLAGWVVERHRLGTMIDWPEIWLFQSAWATTLFVAFVVFFKPPPDRGQKTEDRGQKTEVSKK
jgi:nucleoside transporter